MKKEGALSNENIIHVIDNGIQYLQFRKLLEYKNIKHCITLKELDFGTYTTYKDNKDIIIENYKKICKSVNMDYKNIIRPIQTHTDIIKKVEKKENKDNPDLWIEKLKDVDGLITKDKNLILSLGYGDCIPIFLFDKSKNVIANVHSGWKGTVKQISKKALIQMIEQYKTNPEDVICFIGPSIRKCHFEVKEDVEKIFTEEFKNILKLTEIIKKPFIDTVYINKIILKKMGVKEENIIDSNLCTVCNSDKIYSYRAEKDDKRFTTLIELV